LRQLVAATGLSGLDLGVKEGHVAGRRRAAHRPGSRPTSATPSSSRWRPVAPALQGRTHLSGFSYELPEGACGSRVAWYNTQFYCGWGRER
jgi:hypothetical protein